MDIKDVLGAGEVGKEVIKQAGELVKEPIANLTNPTTKNIGNTFADIWFLVFGGISHAADKRKMRYANNLKKFENGLEEKISTIPDDKKVEPPLNVVGPALEAAKYYIEDEKLREMFADLIASSMNIDTKNLAHPSFVEIIKQLSLSDIKLLETISANSIRNEAIRNSAVNGISYVVAELRAYEVNEPKSALNPFRYQIIKQSMKDFRLADDTDDYEGLLEEISVSYDNLLRLNLIENKVELGEIPAYKDFEKSSYMKFFTKDIPQNNDDSDMPFQLEYHYTWHIVKLTKYGITFCDVVMPISKH